MQQAGKRRECQEENSSKEGGWREGGESRKCRQQTKSAQENISSSRLSVPMMGTLRARSQDVSGAQGSLLQKILEPSSKGHFEALYVALGPEIFLGASPTPTEKALCAMRNYSLLKIGAWGWGRGGVTDFASRTFQKW